MAPAVPEGGSLPDRFQKRIVAAMATLVLAVTTLAIVDQRRAADEALAELSHEQARLAQALAGGVRHRAAASTPQPPVTDAALVEALLDGARPLEVPGERMVLLIRPDRAGLLASDGRVFPSERLMRAFAQGERSSILPRDEAVDFGLPQRVAVAGLARVEAGQRGRWGLIALSSAQNMRDRQRRADWRLALGVLVVGASVLAFGLAALERQRRSLSLAARLALQDLERARDEQLRRADKMATVAALSTGIAHELATPLAVIAARTEQLSARVAADERASRAVAAIAEQVQRIHRVMRGFLALARGDAPALERTDPRALLTEAVELVRHRFEKRSLRLRMEADDSLPRVSCEPLLFEQALVNLLLNACDASGDRGEVVASVRREGDLVVFEILDDGVGMSPEDASRALQPFFTTKPRGRGTGLGLTIANEIIKHHQGDLSFSLRRPHADEASPPVTERGTRARVSIPAAP